MQQFDYTVVHVEGAGDKHAIADCISRLHGPQKQATLSTAAMTTRAQSSAAKALLESSDAPKTGSKQFKTLVSKSKTLILDSKQDSKRDLRPRNKSKTDFGISKTQKLDPKTRFRERKQRFSETKHAKTQFGDPKAPVSDTETPVLERGDSENTSWKGADGEKTSEHIGCATEFTQVHSRADPKGRTDSSVSRRGKKRTQSEDARNAEAEHISVHLDFSDCERPNKKRKQPAGITPEIVKTIQAYHNTVIGHMGTQRTWNKSAAPPVLSDLHPFFVLR